MKKIGIGIVAAIMDVNKAGLACVIISVVMFIASMYWVYYNYTYIIQTMPDAEQVTVELTDREGNSYVVTGMGVTDESGKVMIDLTEHEDEKEEAKKGLKAIAVYVGMECFILFLMGIWCIQRF